MTGFSSVLIDGVDVDPATASIPVSDLGYFRGFGVYEVLRGIGGRCFRIDLHLARLTASASMLGIDLPDRTILAEWATRAASNHDHAMVKILVSAGDDQFTGTPRVVVTSESAPDQTAEITLLPVPAPWHSDGAEWELVGAKTLSYANNFGAVRTAKLAGFGDALLLGRSGRILEGSTFSVGWVVNEDGRSWCETPAISLGILDSITRHLAFDSAADVGIEIREVEVGLERLEAASEFFTLSTFRPTVPVSAVGERRFDAGPTTAALRAAMQERTAREMEHGPTLR